MSTLYLVATPIGNLADLSPRAVETLLQSDRIACEDTRVSSHLLNHFGISKPLISFHQQNEHRRVTQLIAYLNAGETVSLISDAGMPGISDPGFLAVRAAHQSGHTVRVIPGPDACTTALVASGLPCERYSFEGFLPPKKGRKTRLEEIAARDTTTVIYESPHRILRLLRELAEHAGEERLACVARELTKKFEEISRDTVGNLLADYQERDSVKGEFVIVLAGINFSD